MGGATGRCEDTSSVPGGCGDAQASLEDAGGEAHLLRTVDEFLVHYNHERTIEASGTS